MSKILIVDDERGPARAIAWGLHKARHEVVIAINAEIAVDALGNGFDMVIADYGLPGETGLWLLGQVGILLPNAVRLLMTGLNDDFDWPDELTFRKPLIDVEKILKMLEEKGE